jgi:cation transport regulator ChaC
MTQQPLEQRIRTVEEAIIWLANNQQSTISTQQRLEDNQELLTESQRRLQSNQEYMAETHRMMSENITLLTQAQIESKQRHEETDQRFNILLQEIRHLSGRMDDLE